MNRSTEIKDAVLRLYESVTRGDVSTIERLFSRQSGVLTIGSDPGEWWADYDTIVGAFKEQFQESGTRQIRASELTAFAEGTVGWSADRRTMRLPNGKEITIRETFIFHKEDAEWKIVQMHASLAVPNAELLGKELKAK